MKKTVLYEKHLALNAKMSPFGGFEMPIQYEGIIKEHNAARKSAAIFDTCHMGEFLIQGTGVVEDLERIVSCSVKDIKIGGCRYGLICNEQGGVIDDQILYRLQENKFFMVVNASTQPGDFQWIKEHLSENSSIENLSDQTAKVDIQGPLAPKILSKLMTEPIEDMKYFTFKYNYCHGEKVLVSRTGYTGEIGFEIYCSNDLVLKLWDECIELGAVPAGLGARDTLRLEMGLPLYGHELREDINAAESGLTRSIASKDFIGSSVVLDSSKRTRILSGIIIDGRRAGRAGDIVLDSDGNETSFITSGSFSPSLGIAIALAYVKPAPVGEPVKIKTERGELTGKIAEVPFYKEATARADIRKFL